MLNQLYNSLLHSYIVYHIFNLEYNTSIYIFAKVKDKKSIYV
jgi:hypothetical protein